MMRKTVFQWWALPPISSPIANSADGGLRILLAQGDSAMTKPNRHIVISGVRLAIEIERQLVNLPANISTINISKIQHPNSFKTIASFFFWIAKD